MEWIYGIAALASAFAAVLAWVAKLVWSKEYIAAKNETIKAKEAQIETLKSKIESLRELTPMKIREYFLSVKVQLEEYNEKLKLQLNDAKSEIKKKNQKIEKLHFRGDEQSVNLKKLIFERDQIQDKAQTLELQVQELRKKYEADDVVIWRIPRIDTDIFRKIALSSEALRNQLLHQTKAVFNVVEMSKELSKYFASADQYAKLFEGLTMSRLKNGELTKEKTDGGKEDN